MLAKHKNLIYKTIIAIVLVILSVVIYIYFTPIRDVVNLLVISFVIAYTLKPLKNYLSERLNISSKKSSLLIILLFLLSFVGLLYCIVPSILNESGNFGIMLDSIEEYILVLASRFKFDRLPIFETIYIQVGEKINMILSSASTNLVDNMIS
ncbi:MAG: AI-2E family transporter, partial [Bacilli bacterium]|nr:AI-2E family transporter [Bacilli bacterium]